MGMFVFRYICVQEAGVRYILTWLIWCVCLDLKKQKQKQAALPQGIVPFVFAKEYNVHPDILSTAWVQYFLMSKLRAHTHTHTHTHIYIYIYPFLFSFNLFSFLFLIWTVSYLGCSLHYPSHLCTTFCWGYEETEEPRNKPMEELPMHAWILNAVFIVFW